MTKSCFHRIGIMFQKIFFKSTHIAEQNLFSMLPSIFTFYSYLIFGSFKTFWGPNGLFLGSG